MASLSFIHPSVVDLYVLTLKLNELGLMIDGYVRYDTDPPLKLQEEAEKTSIMFANVEKEALDFSGSRAKLNQLLILLHTKRGVS